MLMTAKPKGKQLSVPALHQPILQSCTPLHPMPSPFALLFPLPLWCSLQSMIQPPRSSLHPTLPCAHIPTGTTALQGVHWGSRGEMFPLQPFSCATAWWGASPYRCHGLPSGSEAENTF